MEEEIYEKNTHSFQVSMDIVECPSGNLLDSLDNWP